MPDARQSAKKSLLTRGGGIESFLNREFDCLARLDRFKNCGTDKARGETRRAMERKLTWDDLLMQSISEADARTWLGYWNGMFTGTIAPIFMSKFGDWFLRRPDTGTDELSVIEGRYSKIAATPDEFQSLVNTQAWQEEHLLSFQVWQLHERGL